MIKILWVLLDVLIIKSLKKVGGPEGDRTPDLLHAMQALSQLSYRPMFR